MHAEILMMPLVVLAMHWEILIIPLIALGVWILGTLFKGGEDDKTKKSVRRPGNVANRGGVRRPVTDLDRFLEEARRRREAEERPQTKAAPPPLAPIARPPLREARPSAPAPRPAPPVVRREPVPVAVPVPVAATVSAAPVAPPPVRQPPPSSAPVSPREVPQSSIAQQVRALLSKPQSAGAAFVLREIFDRPLCKRRR